MRWSIIFLVLCLGCCGDSSFGDETKQVAWDAAQQAAYIQSGVSTVVSQIQNYGQFTARKYITKFGMEKLIVIGAYTHKTLRTQEIQFKIQQTTVSIKPIAISIAFPIN